MLFWTFSAISNELSSPTVTRVVIIIKWRRFHRFCTADQYHNVMKKKTGYLGCHCISRQPCVCWEQYAYLVPAWEDQCWWCSRRYQLLANKTVWLGALSKWLFKKVATTLGPYITAMLNASLEFDRFSSLWKHAIVIPLLKKVGLKEISPTTTGFPFLSKVLERIVHKQTICYQSSSRHTRRDTRLKLQF